MNNDRRWSRRRLLRWGLGGAAGVVVAGATGLELVQRGVIPGRLELDALDGACAVSAPPLAWAGLGPSRSGRFHSRACNRTVGYTVAYPPGHRVGDALPVVVMLHGFGADHTDALSGLSPAQAVALTVGGRPLRPMAMVTVDGGPGYWHPHPGDDPMAMLVDEFLPRCRAMGLGRGADGVGAMGISMGGYGAILLGEMHPDLVSAVAAISPAVWTIYAQAHAANPGAYSSAADFAAYDVVTHTAALRDIPVRVASGNADPFHAGVQALARTLPRNATIEFSAGCHSGPFFTAQEPASLAFLARHLPMPL